IGALIAVGSCIFMYSYALENIAVLMNSIMGNSVISLNNISTYIGVVLLITGITVGVLGSIMSVKKHLKV
ncbi:MAG: hypothetical protein ACRC92_14955, partial [Peptostreptococcaceae bacterium]